MTQWCADLLPPLHSTLGHGASFCPPRTWLDTNRSPTMAPRTRSCSQIFPTGTVTLLLTGGAEPSCGHLNQTSSVTLPSDRGTPRVASEASGVIQTQLEKNGWSGAAQALAPVRGPLQRASATGSQPSQPTGRPGHSQPEPSAR